MEPRAGHDCSERRHLDFMQHIGGVGYLEYDTEAREIALPPASQHLLASILCHSSQAAPPLLEALDNAERTRFQLALEQAASGNLPLDIELRLAGESERDCYIRVRGAPFGNGTQQPRFACVFQDITDEKQRNADHENVITQLHALLDVLPQGVSMVDRDLRLIFWNRRFHEILGFPQSLVYKHARFEEFVRFNAARGEYGPGDAEQQVRAIVARAREFLPHRFERPLTGGRTVLVEGLPFKSGGVVSGFVTIYTDITEQKRTEEQLTRQRDVMQTIVDNFPGGISLCDPDLRFTTYNAQFLELLDFPPSLFENGGAHFEELARFNTSRGEYGPGDMEEQVSALLARARNFQAHRMERMRPNGRWLEVRGTPIASGGFVTSYIDITERKQSELALLKSKQSYDALVAKIPVGICILRGTEEGWFSLDYASPCMGEIFDRSVESLLAHPLTLFKAIHPEDFESFASLGRACIQTSSPMDWKGRIVLDGAVKWLHVESSPERQESGDILWHGLVTDITESKRMEDQVRQLALYDALTGLPNRRLLSDRVAQALAVCKRHECHGALMFLDLDNFKPLNDTHGHAAGDLLLIEAANRLKSCVREVDTVARFGGDEFVVMLSGLIEGEAESVLQAKAIAEKIHAVLSAPYRLTVGNVTVEHQCTASIGVVVFDQQAGSEDDILKWADAAMYEAKEAGRNLIRFYGS
jgi:diguanylate cyclase (GGDEF)-like protein